MALYLIRLRRDTKVNWESNNPILGNGELGFDTTSNVLRIGNGVLAWNLLSNSLIHDANGGVIDPTPTPPPSGGVDFTMTGVGSDPESNLTNFSFT